MASNIGRAPIIIPENLALEIVKLETHKELVFVLKSEGKEQKWALKVPTYFNFTLNTSDDSNRMLYISPKDKIKLDPKVLAYWGVLRKLIANITVGLTEGYTCKLGVRGVGYKFELDSTLNNTFLLYLGFTQPLRVTIPDSIECKLLKNNTILEGKSNNLNLVTNELNKIRLLKPASKDKYKNKGLYIL